MKWAQCFLCAIFLAILLGFWHGNTLPSAAVVCGINGTCVGIGGGSALFTAATCDGNPAHNDTPAFTSFNTWARTWQASHSGLIELDIPHGATCMFISGGPCSGAACPANGIKKLRVVGLGYTGNGDGATFSDNAGAGSGFFLGALPGQYFDNLHSGRVATVSAGASSVTLTEAGTGCAPSCASLFVAGNYALITGIDLMGSGGPTNPGFYEYVKITGVSGEVVSFDAPLANTYKSTWPVYFAGNANIPDEGGAATLYALNPFWDTEVQYIGLTFSQAGSTFAAARSATFTNTKWTGSFCLFPTENHFFKITNADMTLCGMEVDKINDTVIIDNVNIRQMDVQSASGAKDFTLSNSTVGTINGAPKKTTVSNSTVTTWTIGPTAFGVSTDFTCANSTATNFSVNSSGENNVHATYTMSGGVMSRIQSLSVATNASTSAGSNVLHFAIGALPANFHAGLSVSDGTNPGSFPSSPSPSVVSFTTTTVTLDANALATVNSGDIINFADGPAPWAVPGGDYYFGTGNYTFAVPFKVTDITTDGTNTLIHTDQAGGFPSLTLGTGGLTVRSHPAIKFNAPNCSGDQALATYATAAANAPYGSYAKYTVTGAQQNWPGTPLWGNLLNLSMNVTTAYTGTQPTLTLEIGSGGANVLHSTTQAFYDPTANVKITANRLITPSTASGAQSGDANMTAPGQTWFANGIVPHLSANVSGESSSVWPTVTVEITTDQGTLPYLLKRDLDPASNDNTPMWLNKAA